MARGRTMTSILQQHEDNDKLSSSTILAIVNCHLEGHPRQYAARIRQLQHAMDDLSKGRHRYYYSQQHQREQWQQKNLKLNGLIIAGDFNCELQSSACSTYLRIGRLGKKGGLGGVHGPSAMVMPPKILESEEAAEVLNPIIEFGHTIDDTCLMANSDNDNNSNNKHNYEDPHPFRRNSMVSAYPPQLGQNNPKQHFTYCANPYRPVAGLDQIWYSGYSLTRIALRKMFVTSQCKQRILQNGLPLAPNYPSDHLPIGAVFYWNGPYNTTTAKQEQRCHYRRELMIDKIEPKVSQKPKSPIMAYAELDMLLVTCPYDNDEQRIELESIINFNIGNLIPTNPREKPSKEQLQELAALRKRKTDLILNASESARIVLQRILKLKKNVAAY
mmetsp:Transcript_9995/g.11410  ORF Transcript_9995/g.11410 Transcript_9995/m.11410 type:complete len:387 (+) Transcript_9995:166-1326(+)